MNLYLIETSGQGDLNIDLVEEDIWDVIFNGSKSNYLESVKEKYLSYKGKYFTPDEGDWKEFLNSVDRGSENDAVLQILFLAKHHFISARDFANFTKENPNITIAGEWSGYIY